MLKRSKSFLFFLIIALNLCADRLSKYFVREYLPRGREVPVIGSFFVLRYAENRGAFLSMGAGLPPVIHLILLKILPAVVLVLMFLYVLFRIPGSRMQLAAFGCVIGGGVGNLLDRVFPDAEVVDFLLFRLGPLRTGILNIADLSITVGCVLIFLTLRPGKPGPDAAGLQD